MGMPVPETISDYINYNSTVVRGIIRHIDEIPPDGPTHNIEGTRSDPNYLGAYDLDTIRYTRIITVEVVKFEYVVSKHHPAIFNENTTNLKLHTYVYRLMSFDVSREERTDKVIRKQFKKEIETHKGEVEKMNKSLDGKTQIFIVYPMLDGRDEGIHAYRKYDSLAEIKKEIKTHPKGTFIKGW